MTDHILEAAAQNIPAQDLIDIQLITVPDDRLRSLKEHRVDVLRADIDFNGLLQPILVAIEGNGYRLVDGLHRLNAITALKHKKIPAVVLPAKTDEASLRYGEIMANINREDLTKLERAENIAALKAAWKNLNPSARHGGDRRSARIRAFKERENEKNGISPVLGLNEALAEKVGLSLSAFKQCFQIAHNLADNVKKKIKSQSLAFENDHTFLLKLSQQPADIQEKIIDILLDENQAAKTIDDALGVLEGRPPLPQSDKFLNRTISNWGRMPSGAKEYFIETFKNDFLKVARKKGWTL